jgi:hypothetical protein
MLLKGMATKFTESASNLPQKVRGKGFEPRNSVRGKIPLKEIKSSLKHSVNDD